MLGSPIITPVRLGPINNFISLVTYRNRYFTYIKASPQLVYFKDPRLSKTLVYQRPSVTIYYTRTYISYNFCALHLVLLQLLVSPERNEYCINNGRFEAKNI